MAGAARRRKKPKMACRLFVLVTPRALIDIAYRT